MPTTKSAAKRLRQSLERRDSNRSGRKEIRTLSRKVRDAVKAGDVAKAEDAFRKAVVTLDKAAAKKVIHSNAAARTKSRLSAVVKAAKTSGKS